MLAMRHTFVGPRRTPFCEFDGEVMADATWCTTAGVSGERIAHRRLHNIIGMGKPTQ
jgi:hypothetical protein